MYTSDQRVRRNDRRGTRQNPNGNRHGLECPEERDYYPWWAPTPWIDIAVLSDSAQNEVCYPNSTSCSLRCAYYMNNTMNYNKKGYCDVDHTSGDITEKTNNNDWRNNRWYNNKDACVAAGFHWYEISHADNLNLESDNFVCAHTQFSRVNQLGNARADDIVSQSEQAGMVLEDTKTIHGVNANRFLWTVPKIPTAKKAGYFTAGMDKAYKSCVLRMRYNVSSADFPSWPTVAAGPDAPKMVDSSNNSQSEGDPNNPLSQDPYVYIGPGAMEQSGSMFVSLAVNTNQFGRTFQDRSYVFSIKPLPTENATASNQADSPPTDATSIQNALASGGKIFNVNVRGKRGNIVQTYPAVEYDFVPNQLALSKHDMVHFQWTGSDYNPRRGCKSHLICVVSMTSVWCKM